MQVQTKSSSPAGWMMLTGCRNLSTSVPPALVPKDWLPRSPRGRLCAETSSFAPSEYICVAARLGCPRCSAVMAMRHQGTEQEHTSPWRVLSWVLRFSLARELGTCTLFSQKPGGRVTGDAQGNPPCRGTLRRLGGRRRAAVGEEDNSVRHYLRRPEVPREGSDLHNSEDALGDGEVGGQPSEAPLQPRSPSAGPREGGERGERALLQGTTPKVLRSHPHGPAAFTNVGKEEHGEQMPQT